MRTSLAAAEYVSKVRLHTQVQVIHPHSMVCGSLERGVVNKFSSENQVPEFVKDSSSF